MTEQPRSPAPISAPAATTTGPDTAGSRQPKLSEFSEVEAWIFDLDNTLYPRHSNLFAQIDDRIRAYVSSLLNVDPEEAHKIQKRFYEQHGTTLAGLMAEHHIDPDEFLEFVHDIDHSPVAPDPTLGEAIGRLPGRKFIFTNGSRSHAERVAERLGVTAHFEDIFDIVAADLVPKPQRQTYERFVNRFDVYPQNAAMFEDLVRNLVVPKSVGMRTVLVVPPVASKAISESWERDGHADGATNQAVDFVTDDLPVFIGEIADTLGRDSSGQADVAAD